MSRSLGVIRQYQDAHDRHDTSRALAAFAADATVIDEDHEHRGTAAIRQWLDTAAREFTYTRHRSRRQQDRSRHLVGRQPTRRNLSRRRRRPAVPIRSPATVVLPSSSSHPDHADRPDGCRSARVSVARSYISLASSRRDGSTVPARVSASTSQKVQMCRSYSRNASRRCRYSSSSISPRAKRCARTSSALLGAAGIADCAGGE